MLLGDDQSGNRFVPQQLTRPLLGIVDTHDVRFLTDAIEDDSAARPSADTSKSSMIGPGPSFEMGHSSPLRRSIAQNSLCERAPFRNTKVFSSVPKKFRRREPRLRNSVGTTY